MTDLMSPEECKAAGLTVGKDEELMRKFNTWIANRKWAKSLTIQELTEQLIMELWSIEKFYTKQFAILEEVIDRLQKGDEQDGPTQTNESS